MEKIIIGVSSCLLGHEVRYDGSHKRNDYILQTLGQYFEFRPFCPELESGLGVPRPTIHLLETDNGVRCVAVKNHSDDKTNLIRDCSARQDDWLQTLSGYLVKKDSPSCGMERVKVYRPNNQPPHKIGVGLFVQHLQSQFPLLPIEEEGRLGNPVLRENFIQRVYVFHRWRHLLEQPHAPRLLTEFHARHKLICMSHDQNLARNLGRVAASADKNNIQEVIAKYGTDLMHCLKKTATRGNHTNVLQHIQGYLKTTLSADDKAEMSETIEQYRLGYVPLIVPITLLKHHFRKAPDPFIQNSYYLTPYPQELAILNEI